MQPEHIKGKRSDDVLEVPESMHTVQRKKQKSAKDSEPQSTDERKKRKQRQKQKGIIFVTLLTICFLTGACPVKAEEELKLYARSAVLMDGSSGRILYGKETREPLPMASTTKIMTCIVALEEAKEDMACTASEQAARQPQVKLGMQTGEKFYLKDLLYSLMLESHNDTAVCIAENVAGSVEGFAEKMNAKAREIGCEDTYYISPNGLDGENAEGMHHTTAADLALVLRYCITQSPQAEDFLEITGTAQYTFTDISGKHSYSCANHNAFLWMMDGALTGKTGFTAKAGYCYVGALQKDDRLLIVSLLACGWPGHRSWKWADTRTLMNYGLEQYHLSVLESGKTRIAPAAVENGIKNQVELIEEHGGCRLLLRRDEKVIRETQVPKVLRAPVEEGTSVGIVRYQVGDTVVLAAPVRTAEGVRGKGFWYGVDAAFEKLLL